MMRMNMGQNQMQQEQNRFDMSGLSRDMTGMEVNQSLDMSSMAAHMRGMEAQQQREEAVTRQMMGMHVTGGHVDTTSLRHAFGAMNMENQPSMEVAPNPSYTEYMIERVKLEESSSESTPYHQSRSPLFLSSLASNALQTR